MRTIFDVCGGSVYIWGVGAMNVLIFNGESSIAVVAVVVIVE